MNRTQQLLFDAALELSAFWSTPEAAVIREQESHVLILIDQKDPRNHAVMRRLGTEPSLAPEVSKWTTLVLPCTDFDQKVVAAIERKRGQDLYPLLILADNTLRVCSIPDDRAQPVH